MIDTSFISWKKEIKNAMKGGTMQNLNETKIPLIVANKV